LIRSQNVSEGRGGVRFVRFAGVGAAGGSEASAAGTRGSLPVASCSVPPPVSKTMKPTVESEMTVMARRSNHGSSCKLRRSSPAAPEWRRLLCLEL
jgi:hypothetical protein